MTDQKTNHALTESNLNAGLGNERIKENELKELLSSLRQASCVIGGLTELPGYNGSILMIDDIEAEKIVKAIDEAVSKLELMPNVKLRGE